MGNLRDLAGRTAYLAAIEAGLGREVAREHKREAARRATTAIAADPAVKNAFSHLRLRMIDAVREAQRLRRERDALLACFAEAAGLSEAEAWQIARLDIEPDRERDEADLVAWEDLKPSWRRVMGDYGPAARSSGSPLDGGKPGSQVPTPSSSSPSPENS